LKTLEDTAVKKIIAFITNRQLILFVLFGCLFFGLAVRLFELQIVKGENYRYTQEVMRRESIPVPPIRGSVYDRLGRPLAVNKTAYTVKIDANVNIKSHAFLELVRLFAENGEKSVDIFPITKTDPMSFNFAGKGISRERWLLDMDFTEKEVETYKYNPRATFKRLREKFGVPEEVEDQEAREVLNLCTMLYRQRYHTYDPITIAYEVKPETVIAIEEDNIKFDGIYVDMQSLREYPQGSYFSHIIGYIGKISDEELSDFKDLEYSSQDQIGKSGLEQNMEPVLRGEPGRINVEVNGLGKRVRYLPEKKDPVHGRDIYLTLDTELQQASMHILEDMLRQTIINQLVDAEGNAEHPLTLEKLFSSMIRGNVVSISRIMDSNEYDDSYVAKKYILDNYAYDQSHPPEDDELSQIKEILVDGISESEIRFSTMLLILLEQGIITGDEEYAIKLRNGAVRPLTAVLNKLREGEITPQMTNLDPSTGSVVVVDTKTGGILAAAGYPYYDANEFVNNINVEYFVKTTNDPTTPLYNRPFREGRAPGSTFKMITAITALERGSISLGTNIYDLTTFTDAGKPYLNCWSSVSHGYVNVVDALEVSCNYFFCESAYRLGNTKSGNKLDSIHYLNEFMEYFGLNEKTGVEIGERNPRMSSPQYKDEIRLNENPEATAFDRDWYDGDTVQTAIGQSFNSYTAASMAKYIMTLANRGVRYRLHLVDTVASRDRSDIEKSLPYVEVEMPDVLNSTWDAVYRGMLLCTEGFRGTGTKIFQGFPVRVAGKTGTAEEIRNRNNHSSFGGFAPFDDPQIAVYVMIPFGDTKANSALASQIAKEIMAVYFGISPSGSQTPEEPPVYQSPLTR